MCALGRQWALTSRSIGEVGGRTGQLRKQNEDKWVWLGIRDIKSSETFALSVYCQGQATPIAATLHPVLPSGSGDVMILSSDSVHLS